MSFNKQILYKIYIIDQNRVIWIQNLQTFKDYKEKIFIKLSDYFESIFKFSNLNYIGDNIKKKEFPML